jgi:beta-N-acetylhexosaminidase
MTIVTWGNTMLERRISRRDILRAGFLGSASLVVAACASRLPSVVPSATVTPVPPSASPTPPQPPSVSAPVPSPSESAHREPTLAEVVAGLVVVGFRGIRLSDAPWLRTELATSGLGGVILFDRDQLTGGERNVRSPRQVLTLVEEVRAAAKGRHVIVGIDQEGGIVTRLSPAHGFPAVASEAVIGDGSATAARAWARTIAGTLAAARIDLNFAPVVDLDVNPDSPAIGALRRSFSADPDVVVRMATLELDAHRAAGVRTAIKHFPGIGSSTTNTDFGVADVTATWTRRELDPFRRLIAAGRVDLVMVGHVVNRTLDAAHPASLSRAVVTDLLREELGWTGPIVTDDLQAVAITQRFGRDEAVLLALEAGNDLLLFANQGVYVPGVAARVVEVVLHAIESGRLSENALRASWRRVQLAFGVAAS